MDYFTNEKAIIFIKNYFQDELGKQLNLIRVTCPLFTQSNTGINDDLNGVERKIKFTTKCCIECEINNSLAKWKRLKLTEYNMPKYSGIYTDMNAIRCDEDLDEIHSYYVDQYDFELVIDKTDMNIKFLKSIVTKLYKAIKNTELAVEKVFAIKSKLPNEIQFIQSQDLLNLYPTLTPKQREYEISKLFGAVFIIGIGAPLSNGLPHDSRACDYDNILLNGDIIVWNPVLNREFELCSMGIRVDSKSLIEQLKMAHHEEKMNLYYHKKLINNELLQTVGGGMGASRLAMLLLNKRHIGEVQSSVWSQEIVDECKKKNIKLL